VKYLFTPCCILPSSPGFDFYPQSIIGPRGHNRRGHSGVKEPVVRGAPIPSDSDSTCFEFQTLFQMFLLMKLKFHCDRFSGQIGEFTELTEQTDLSVLLPKPFLLQY